MQQLLQVDALTVRYPNAADALIDVTFTVDSGEFAVLVGPSGAGKTTVLHVIAGLDPAIAALSGGRVFLCGRDITRTPPYARNMGVVFQEYRLFEHMTVFNNVAFGLVEHGVPRSKRKKKVYETLDLVGLIGLDTRYPKQLSGGQKQRVALARALVIEPELLLLDEPLAAIDKQLRESLQKEIRTIHEVKQCTTIYVTHDQEEAFKLSNKVIIINQGRLEQQGTPVEVYQKPSNRFVAGLLGIHNILEGTVEKNSATSEAFLNVGGWRIPLGKQPSEIKDDCAIAVIHPESVRLGTEATLCDSVFEGRVLWREFRGGNTDLFIGTPGGFDLKCSVSHVPWEKLPSEREQVKVGWNTQNVILLPSEIGKVKDQL